MGAHQKVIIFNGPPNCGKDTASEAVRSFVQINAPWMKPTHMKYSEVLKKGAHSLYAAFHGWDFYDGEGRKEKNDPTGDFLGLSPRQAYIELFNALERLHGPEVLGWIMRKRISRSSHNGLIVCSDGGRPPELNPIIEYVGAKNVLIVEIHATGVTFADHNDIRSYVGDEVKKKHPGVTVVKIPNNIGTRSDRDIFKVLCQGVAKNWLDIEEKEDA